MTWIFYTWKYISLSFCCWFLTGFYFPIPNLLVILYKILALLFLHHLELFCSSPDHLQWAPRHFFFFYYKEKDNFLYDLWLSDNLERFGRTVSGPSICMAILIIFNLSFLHIFQIWIGNAFPISESTYFWSSGLASPNRFNHDKRENVAGWIVFVPRKPYGRNHTGQ